MKSKAKSSKLSKNGLNFAMLRNDSESLAKL